MNTQKVKIFIHFYESDFDSIRSISKSDRPMVQLMERAAEAGYQLILATQPVFPEQAVRSRLNWAGAAHLPWKMITHIGNMSVCKPSPAYFQYILEYLDCEASQCLMIGNDTAMDMPAVNIGIDTFFLKSAKEPDRYGTMITYVGGSRELAQILGLDSEPEQV